MINRTESRLIALEQRNQAARRGQSPKPAAPSQTSQPARRNGTARAR